MKDLYCLTDLADYLVQKHNLPFRKAYRVTKIVNLAETKKLKLYELPIKRIKKIEPNLDENVFKVLNLRNSIKSKKSYGGTLWKYKEKC